MNSEDPLTKLASLRDFRGLGVCAAERKELGLIGI